MDGITFAALDFDRIGVVGLCVLILIALVRGWLVTARELAAATHDRDEWRAESRIKDAQIAEQNKQISEFKHLGETVEQVMRALDDARRGSTSGGSR